MVYCSAEIAQSKKLDVAANTRCTVAGDNSRPCSVDDFRPATALEFLGYMRHAGYSPNTVCAYAYDLD